jgi:site-specific recombinase XerC
MAPASERADPAVRARKVGQWSKRAPYGYVLRKQSLVLGGTEARETVRWLFNEYANTTASVAALARSLNARQVRTVEGGAWHETTVYRILTSPVYCGHMAKRRKLAGVPRGVSPYSARHSFAVQALEAGIGERQIADVLGHTTTKYVFWYSADVRSKPGYLNGIADHVHRRREGEKP